VSVRRRTPGNVGEPVCAERRERPVAGHDVRLARWAGSERGGARGSGWRRALRCTRGGCTRRASRAGNGDVAQGATHTCLVSGMPALRWCAPCGWWITEPQWRRESRGVLLPRASSGSLECLPVVIATLYTDPANGSFSLCPMGEEVEASPRGRRPAVEEWRSIATDDGPKVTPV